MREVPRCKPFFRKQVKYLNSQRKNIITHCVNSNQRALMLTLYSISTYSSSKWFLIQTKGRGMDPSIAEGSPGTLGRVTQPFSNLAFSVVSVLIKIFEPSETFMRRILMHLTDLLRIISVINTLM